MAKRNSPELETPPVPLYHDINEFIDAMGIKQYKAQEAFGVKRANWFKLKKTNYDGLTIENMHSFAMYFNLPPEKVMSLCYMTFIKGLAQKQSTSTVTNQAEEPDISDVDADFPPLD